MVKSGDHCAQTPDPLVQQEHDQHFPQIKSLPLRCCPDTVWL